MGEASDVFSKEAVSSGAPLLEGTVQLHLSPQASIHGMGLLGRWGQGRRSVTFRAAPLRWGDLLGGLALSLVYKHVILRRGPGSTFSLGHHHRWALSIWRWTSVLSCSSSCGRGCTVG